MRPVLKNISTIDGDDASKFTPEDAQCFSLWLRLDVGPSDGEGSESFDVLICSPSWLAGQCERDGFVIGRHHFVVNEYRFDFIRDKLTQFIGHCSGETWSEIAAKVSRIGY
jgi:hypothetical protein